LTTFVNRSLLLGHDQPIYIAGDGQGGCQAILSKYEPAHISQRIQRRRRLLQLAVQKSLA
jgi:hypothetical protein